MVIILVYRRFLNMTKGAPEIPYSENQPASNEVNVSFEFDNTWLLKKYPRVHIQIDFNSIKTT